MSKLSPYEQNIVDFAYVLQKKPDLLSLETKSSLEDLLKNLPDDVNEISNQITLWYENHPNIEKAIFELLELPLNSSVRGAGNRKTKMTPKEAKELIENAMRQSETPKR